MNKPAQDMPEWKGYKAAYVDGLKAENAILREALMEICDYAGPIDQSFCQDMQDMRDIADKALQRAGGGE